MSKQPIPTLDDQINVLSESDVQRQILKQLAYLKEQAVERNKKLESIKMYLLFLLIGFIFLILFIGYLANQIPT